MFFGSGEPPPDAQASSGVWFQPTEYCRGPWDPAACHAGPPTAALAWGVEQVAPMHQLTRLTVDLIRPVPLAGFFVEAEPVRVGRMVATSQARIVDAAGVVRATATASHAAVLEEPLWSDRDGGGQVAVTPAFADALPGPFPIRIGSDLTGFRDAVEVRYPPGEDETPGATTMWMRTIDLYADLQSSPFQRICALADCTNALSRYDEPARTQFMNPDLSIMLHRPPTGEWFGSRAQAVWQPSGVGVATTLLFDVDGPVGWATQTLLLRPSPRG